MRTALTIAGSDSSAGAGIQADLKTFAAHGVFGTTAVTAITAQNTLGVTAATALAADLVTAQIEAVVSDIGVHAAKTGMLANAAIVEAVAAAVADLEIPFLVVDPVIVATSGEPLLDDEGFVAMKAELVRRAHVVTPNVPEAQLLSGVTIRTEQDRREAARRIWALGPVYVVITGVTSIPSRSSTFVVRRRGLHGLRGGAGRRASHTRNRMHLFRGADVAPGARPIAARGDSAGAAFRGRRHSRTHQSLGRGAGPLNHFWRLDLDRGGRL